MLTLEQVQAHARELGLRVDADPVDDQEGYWIIDPVTGEGPWVDGNFSTSLEEVAGKLCAIEYERKEGKQ